MSNYSKNEKLIAKVLSYVPGIKEKVKYCYALGNYILYKKKYTFNSSFPIQNVTQSSSEVFFGYYDKSPENSDERFLIYQKCSQKTTLLPDRDEPIEIIVKDNLMKVETVVAESTAYNWQQGSKLQWLNKTKFIYNFYDKGQGEYKSCIYDVESCEKQDIEFPIYDCFKDYFALSLNFERLAKLRPDYGYRNKTSFNPEDLNDGVFRVDFTKKNVDLIVSIETLKNHFPLDSMKDAKHKVNHLMISPDGENFMFIHRWKIKGGKRFARLFVARSNGEGLKLLADEGMVSHCCWFDKANIIGYLTHQSHGDTFYKINVETGFINLISKELLNYGDGHPTVFKNFMVFDSYPDRSRMKNLFIYDFKKDTVLKLGSFLEPFKFFGETRCDLHPKVNFNKNKIFFESVHEGERQLYSINPGL